MATIFEDVAIDNKFTQKMGGCQSQTNPLQGSDHKFTPVYLHWGGQWK